MLFSAVCVGIRCEKSENMTIILYTTSVTTNREIFNIQNRIKHVLEAKGIAFEEIFNKQNRIKHVFEAKGIAFEEVDLCKNSEQRDHMREKAGIPNLLPPAIFNGDSYCGDFQQFEDAVEDNLLKDFLKIQ